MPVDFVLENVLVIFGTILPLGKESPELTLLSNPFLRKATGIN